MHDYGFVATVGTRWGVLRSQWVCRICGGWLELDVMGIGDVEGHIRLVSVVVQQALENLIWDTRLVLLYIFQRGRVQEAQCGVAI